MREKIDVNDYVGDILKALPKGLLLNTNGDKFNSMVIGWGNIGIVWGRQTFITYIRENRYTKSQLDKTGEFTVSVPVDGVIPEIVQTCGYLSGRNVDKAAEAKLTLVEPEVINTPAVKEYPLTLECRVLYSQKQELSDIPEEIRQRYYPQDVDGLYPMSNRDAHTAYIGEIVSAYIIK